MYFFETDDGEINQLGLISLLHLKHLIFIQMALKTIRFLCRSVCLSVCVRVCVGVCVADREKGGRA